MVKIKNDETIKKLYFLDELNNVIFLFEKGFVEFNSENVNEGFHNYTLFRLFGDGFEKFFRCIIIYCNWGDFNKIVSIIGRTHDIDSLFEKACCEIEKSVHNDKEILDEIKSVYKKIYVKEIFLLLTKFAQYDRYYYYDTIVDKIKVEDETGIIIPDILKKMDDIYYDNKEIKNDFRNIIKKFGDLMYKNVLKGKINEVIAQIYELQKI